LEELGAKFGDEVAMDFEHALEAKTLGHQNLEQEFKDQHLQEENVEVVSEPK
jgi:hypothetical protein